MKEDQLKLETRLIKLQEELKKETVTLCQSIESAIVDFTNKNSIFVEKMSISYEDLSSMIDSINSGEPIALGDLKIEVVMDPTVSPAIKSIPAKSQSNLL